MCVPYAIPWSRSLQMTAETLVPFSFTVSQCQALPTFRTKFCLHMNITWPVVLTASDVGVCEDGRQGGGPGCWRAVGVRPARAHPPAAVVWASRPTALEHNNGNLRFPVRISALRPTSWLVIHDKIWISAAAVDIASKTTPFARTSTITAVEWNTRGSEMALGYFTQIVRTGRHLV